MNDSSDGRRVDGLFHHAIFSAVECEKALPVSAKFIKDSHNVRYQTSLCPFYDTRAEKKHTLKLTNIGMFITVYYAGAASASGKNAG